MDTFKYSQLHKKNGIYRLIGAMGVGFTLRVLSMIERAGRNYLWIPATLRTDSGELVEHEGRDAGLQDLLRTTPI